MTVHCTIYKHVLPPVGTWPKGEIKIKTLVIPEPIHVAYQGDDLCVWVRGFVSDSEKGSLTIAVRGTGHEAPEPVDASHIGTVFQGPFVWHLFAFNPYVASKR